MERSKHKILELACGKYPRKGAVNLDIVDLPGVDVVHDLDTYPWPFPDEEFNEIVAQDIIEHIDDVFKAMGEAWRILKPNGLILIHTTHWKNKGSYTDPQHKHFFTEESFDYFDKDTFIGQEFGFYDHIKPFKIVHKCITPNGYLYIILRKVC
jgi:SAM-dependent methyltransferase